MELSTEVSINFEATLILNINDHPTSPSLNFFYDFPPVGDENKILFRNINHFTVFDLHV